MKFNNNILDTFNIIHVSRATVTLKYESKPSKQNNSPFNEQNMLNANNFKILC